MYKNNAPLMYFRPKFPKNTKYRRINNAGEEEAYVPRHIKFFKYTFSVFICGICVRNFIIFLNSPLRFFFSGFYNIDRCVFSNFI